ncbi:MAG TPA: hypothetical protein VHW45_20110 [Candidatus Sulfotelmatobacter sp.]|jgi:hypothetical protein|nr:hypothetical protein [Candidatus Sulfotelmatobacter sp.]
MLKRTRNQGINQCAADVIRKSTRISDEPAVPLAMSQVMTAMGRSGGLKGAATLNARLSPAQRKKSAPKAERARWGR